MNEDHPFCGLTFACELEKGNQAEAAGGRGRGTEAHPGNTEARRQPRMRGRMREARAGARRRSLRARRTNAPVVPLPPAHQKAPPLNRIRRGAWEVGICSGGLSLIVSGGAAPIFGFRGSADFWFFFNILFAD